MGSSEGARGRWLKTQRNLAQGHNQGAEKTIILVCNEQRPVGIRMHINVLYIFLFLTDIEIRGLQL